MRSPKPRVGSILLYLVLLLFVAYTVTPFVITWFTALKSKGELVSNPLGPPRKAELPNLAAAWKQGRLGRYSLNSLAVALPVLVAASLLSVTSAYALSFFRLPGRGGILSLFILGLTLPMEAAIIQLYYHMKSLGLLDTLQGLVLAQVGLSMPFGTYFLFTAFRDMPRSLVEAAEIDGAGTWKVLWRILLPALGPSLTVLALLFFIWTWNEFLLALVLIGADSLRTLPVGMAFFQGKYVGNAPLTAMGATIMSLPAIVLYLCLQRYFISGMTAGALKG
ncbi:MAG TPA: carbohydrate ABC transporter permease [Spirochaetales bacterium]|nr:carbohydrate ABC transporter permease [Spirochaetales bacterium]HRY53783.1 carbohydrate ABC transporter permease [Spirochaetia bacterium]HRZ64971.1 carbohydrate ABC transporter permease [Spirochaetia bacterium]